MSLLYHRRIIGASDLDGYGRAVVTEDIDGGNVIFVDERAGLGPACDLFNSAICERKVSS